jgi:acetyl-CoA carboxylase biotin carboxyl carrier protein
LDLKEIKELIALIKKNDLAEFELEQGDFKIKLKKSGGELQPMISVAPVAAAQAPAAAAAPVTAQAAAPAKEGTPGKEIVSPMVGTFYASASPESPPFVDVGAQVTEDTVVCIIEAMKVMNEIKAEARGTVSEILVENGKPVQFGQVLFRLK